MVVVVRLVPEVLVVVVMVMTIPHKVVVMERRDKVIVVAGSYLQVVTKVVVVEGLVLLDKTVAMVITLEMVVQDSPLQ